ncbi:glycosyltransferase family 4 protein [Mucilaginibacter gotjawali]|uniref:Glycosyltransferase involved in cell wall biosynthesis n=1 Tax=Mucilaginibacter gotjawali TaxID=1550579 RepID=A0A839SFR8_9SPHI|nr:glycosyltransferase family 4 protein [Mucilaginibacter gotjawali]MBB3057111.1 glycosyltransferase involved in cell wall biosynthesis [Mucilaginibacter gotjawali]
MKKLAIITTHPIQYYAPVFQLLHKRAKLDIRVFYTWGEASADKFDPGFNKKIKWDIPLLEGYSYEWVENTSKDPGTHHFKGIVNPGLVDQIKNWQPDALLIYGWGFQSHLKVLRYFKNKLPVFFRGDSTLLDEEKGVKAILKTIFLKWVYRHVDHAFYPGTNARNYFKKYGIDDEQLSFAPHAIDNGRFAAGGNEEALLLRRNLGIEDDEILVLFAGKFEEKKSPVLLLEAFLNLDKAGLHLLFAGNGPLEEQLILKAEKNSRVHFMDFQNQTQMPVVFKACDLFCLPSKGPGETWGLAINEAMAAGKAILASDKVGAAADLVIPGENGEIFNAGTIADLAEKLNKLICAGKNALAEMGRKSKNLVEKWTIEEQVNVIETAVDNG